MIELRLIPPAVVAWVCVVLVIARVHPVAVLMALAVGMLVARLWGWGQVLLSTGVAMVAALLTWLRVQRAGALSGVTQLTGRVVGQPRPGPFGQALTLREETTGTHVQMFLGCGMPAPPRGAQITAQVSAIPADRMSLVPVDFRASHLSVTEAPGSLSRFGAAVIARFQEMIAGVCGQDSPAGAVLAAMVFGDTSGYSGELKDTFRETGLAHLSAVSGANIAIVAGAAWWVALRLPRVGRVLVALGAIGAYAVVVGPEPSVIRASIMGAVGLVSILAARQATALHALALSVLGVLLWDSAMAISPGFLLSCLATAGIIAVQPALVRLLVPLRCPKVLTRAVAVTLAAHLVTAPVIAVMSGKFSVVAVLANILAAPFVAPVTVLGLVGAVSLLLGLGPVAWLCTWLATRLTWVIVAIANLSGALPGASVTLPEGTSFAWALLIGAWVVYLLAVGRWRVVLAAMVAALLLPGGAALLARDKQLDPAHVPHVRVRTVEEAQRLLTPPGTQLIVVTEDPPQGRRTVVTRDGIPILFTGTGCPTCETDIRAGKGAN